MDGTSREVAVNFHLKRLMRTRIVILGGVVLLAACSSNPNVVYVPAPAPLPTEMPPVAVSIVRADESRLLVSTNQASYLAVFEIVPGRGVSLVYPTSPRQRRVTTSGSNWLPVFWRSQRRGYDDDRYALRDQVVDAVTSRHRADVHYVYAIASDRPLRLTDSDFDDDYLRSVLGERAYRATSPYETMDELSRRFVPPQMDEDWGEDLYTMDVARPNTVVRIAKVYCADGSIYSVPEAMTERAWCSSHGRARGDGPTNSGNNGGGNASRPDSVVASNGRPVKPGFDPRMRTPLFRVPKPGSGEAIQAGTPMGGGTHTDSSSHGNGNGNANGQQGNDHPDNGHDANDHGNNGHQDNGHHYGSEHGNHGQGNSGNSGGNAQHGNAQPDTTHGNVNNNGRRPMYVPGMQMEAKPTPAAPTTPATPATSAAKPEAKPDSSPGVPLVRRAVPRKARPDSTSDTTATRKPPTA